jgi:uncharacterized protein (PEP-CTERM system associated)
VSYSERYTTSQALQLTDRTVADGQTSAPGIGGAFDFFNRNEIPGGTLTNEVFLQKSYSASIRRTIKRTTISISGSREERSYDGGTGEKSNRGSLTVSHTFSRLVSLTATGYFLDRKESTLRNDDIYSASVYLNRSLVGSASVFLSYDYTRRDSNDPLFDLQENAITAGLTASF